MPRVSVILPTYNDLGYLKLAIETALDQIYTDFELIVVNDGSTDGSKEYLDALAHEKLRVVHKENGGCFDALNAGLDYAQGELITWVSSDNLSPNYFLEALVAGIDCYPEAKFAYASYFNINKVDFVTSVNHNNHQFPHELVSATHRGSAAFMYYKSCHDKVGKYIDSYSCDTDMWAKLSSFYPTVYIMEPIYLYRIHEKRVTERLGADYYFDTLEQIWEGYKQLHGNHNIIQSLYSIGDEKSNPDEYHYAINDIATRFMHENHINIAMKFWRESTSKAPANVIKLIVHNLAQITATQPDQRDKIFGLFRNAIKKNKAISKKTADKYNKRLMDLSRDAVEDGASDFISNTSWLKRIKLRRLRFFSYLAWKEKIQKKCVSMAGTSSP